MRFFRYADTTDVDRRRFLHLASLGVGCMATGGFRILPARAGGGTEGSSGADAIRPTADAVIFIYMGGGQASHETWDPKRHTPFEKGMKAADVHSTFASIPTAVDGIRFSAGLEQVARVMHKGVHLPAFQPTFMGGSFHVRHIFDLHTAYMPPQAVAVPSSGAVIARALGSRHPDVPAYVDIGYRPDIATAEIRAAHSPGFLGSAYGPFTITDPAQATVAVRPPSGMSRQRFNDRHKNYRRLARARVQREESAVKRDELVEAIDAAHRLLDSPAAAALDLALEPKESFDAYDTGTFGQGCLLARRMIEAGSRYVQVSFEFDPFKQWDTHENGHARVAKLKREIDAPIARLIRDLDERGLLERTLVVLASEFSRSMLVEGDGGKATELANEFERKLPGNIVKVPDLLTDEKHYGMHRHYTLASSALLFGGGMKQGYRHGHTADEPPFAPVDGVVSVPDLHATIHRALGLPADLSYEVEGRPFYATPDGKGRAVADLFA